MTSLRFHRSRFATAAGGTSAVEFAIISPIFIMILMGIMEFGLILYAYNSTQDAARDIVRRIAVNALATTDATATATAKGETVAWLSPYITASVTQTTPAAPSTNIITVDVAFPAAKAAPTGFFSYLFGDAVIHSKASMQQEMPQ